MLSNVLWMALTIRNTTPVYKSQDMENDLLVRINGTLPDFSIMGDEEKSERAAEAKKMEIAANTSCSVFSINPSTGANKEVFHLLIDIGEGVVKSIEQGSDAFASKSHLSGFPNAVLITHSHDDHIKELSTLVNKVSEPDKLKICCTDECRDQIMGKFPEFGGKQTTVSFNTIMPGETSQIGPFSVIPVLASHGENSPPGSVIYVVRMKGKKIIFGWDFLSLPNVDESLLWNPDLLILGTQSYNPHPEYTGMISVTDAYQLVRRWNAKECYLVHYRGLTDFQESRNQWFKGPTKAMTSAELQKNIDSHLGISGDNGRFKITVGKEGMIWVAKDSPEYAYDENIPIGNIIEIEGLDQYVCRIEKQNQENKLKLEIEDRINRYTLQFDRPKRDKNNDQIIHAAAEIGMLSRGPELTMELVTPSAQGEENAVLKISAFKGKKYVFHGDILINDMDARKLKKYFQENFEKRSLENLRKMTGSDNSKKFDIFSRKK
ncbi:MAG: MBL fold metallo-hydrolase [Candidatus Nitrosopolaris sp.]